MKPQTEIPYWITLAHLPKWGVEKINRLVVKIIHEQQLNLEAFFALSEADWKAKFQLTDSEVKDLQTAKNELPNNAFLSEEFISQGFDIIPLNAPEYSPTLKNNLKIKAPTVLYVKGNQQILQEASIAIVGSREADAISLEFTDNIARKASQQYKVVVSGFAKGVDQQALESAIRYKGQSIIVLPQGVMTFGSGIKKYYKEITTGDVLVVSVFHPKAVWATGLAMARNPIIYALASEIYVAQSAETGGTWAGVSDGLKKGRTIFVRQPEATEKNANTLLIAKGAVAVDFEGNPLASTEPTPALPSAQESEEIWLTKVLQLIEKQPLTTKQILEQLPAKISAQTLSKKLKALPQVQTIKRANKLHFSLVPVAPTLFG